MQLFKEKTTMPDNSLDDAQLQKIVSALVERFTKQLDLEKYCALFSEDTDWENAFGWRLRGRQRFMPVRCRYRKPSPG
jgi:hypothetical protein